MIRTCRILNVDIISGNVILIDYEGKQYFCNFHTQPVIRVPKIGEQVVCAIDGVNAYIIAYISNDVVTNEIKNFRQLEYRVDSNNFLQFLKDVFKLYLDSGNIEFYNNQFNLNVDTLKISTDNGYLIMEKDKIEINYKVFPQLEINIILTKDKCEISYKTGQENIVLQESKITLDKDKCYIQYKNLVQSSDIILKNDRCEINQKQGNIPFSTLLLKPTGIKLQNLTRIVLNSPIVQVAGALIQGGGSLKTKDMDMNCPIDNNTDNEMDVKLPDNCIMPGNRYEISVPQELKIKTDNDAIIIDMTNDGNIEIKNNNDTIIKINGENIEIIGKKVEIHGDNKIILDSIVNVKDFISSIQDLYNKVNDLIQKYNTHKHFYGNNITGTPTPDSLETPIQ